MFLALGVLAAVLNARETGQGQVVDASIVDGAASLCTGFFGMTAAGLWSQQRGNNVLDSGAPYYDVYECADGKLISVGPLEARFYAQLLQKIGVDTADLGAQNDKAKWAHNKRIIAEAFRAKSRDEWCALLEGTDVCFAPVLSFKEAPDHAHLQARGTFVEVDGVVQPAPALRFSHTPSEMPKPPSLPDMRAALVGWMSGEEIKAWEKKIYSASA